MDIRLVQQFKDDLLILLTLRLGGRVVFSLDEVNNIPKGKTFTMDPDKDNHLFTFEVHHDQ